MNYQDWVHADFRRLTPHWDYGVRWRPDPAVDDWSAHPGKDHRLSWAPDTGELYATDAAGESVHVLATIADQATLETLLHGWAAAGGPPGASLGWVHDRVARYMEITAGSAPAPASLSPAEQARYAGPPEARWALPAEPVAAALRGLRATPGMDDADDAVFAAGLDLDPEWVADVVDGALVDIDVEEIAMVCESLRCTPYDLWPPSAAETILHAYGPEHWPREIEPLSAHRPADDASFVARRLERQVAAMVSMTTPTGPSRVERLQAARPSTTVTVTAYNQTGVVAVTPSGTTMTVLDPAAAADPAVDYHFAFTQCRPPIPIGLAMSPGEFADGPPRGHDVNPGLVAVAGELGLHPATGRAVLVRFTDAATGNEAWLGRIEGVDPAGRARCEWETWDDPRAYWPGDPNVVLDPGGFDDPAMQLRLPLEGHEDAAMQLRTAPAHDLGIDF
jgi:hypothetical protein